MTEGCAPFREPMRVPYKVWRNPPDSGTPLILGEFYPPDGHLTFIFADLEELGFPLGCYTVLIPAAVRAVYVLPEWQTVYVDQEG